MKKHQSHEALILALLLAVLANGRAAGQSVFGLNFLGESRFNASARSYALGLSAFAVPDTTSAIASNPASIADLSRMTFSMFEILGSSTIRSGDVTANQNRFQLPSVMIAVPLRKGLVFGVGYRTRFEGKGDFAFGHPVDSAATAQEIYMHRSSLFTAPLTIAWKATTWASLAGEFQLERGSIRDASTISFQATNHVPVESKRVRDFSGNSWSASILLKPHPRFSLGASWNSTINYDVDETFSYTRDEFDSTSQWDFSLPSAFGLGAAVGVTERWWLSSYFWRRGAPEPRGFTQLAGSIGEERLIAFGIERRPGTVGGFFAKAPLRLGFYEDRWHFEYPAGHPVRSRFVTLGSGFNLPGGPGAIDVSLEFGQIGSISDNGVDEKVFRLGFGVSASEAWSKRKEQH